MAPEIYLKLSKLLRGALLNPNDGEALNGLRLFRKKFEATGADIHEVAFTSVTGAHGVIQRAVEARKAAQKVAHVWETESAAFLRELAADRGGHPPAGATFKLAKDRTETPLEVAERHAKRTAWEIKEAVRRNAELKDRVTDLEQRLAKVREAVQ